MHRLFRPDGSYYQSWFLRFSATISYLMFSLSGLLFILSDILASAYGPTAEFMAGFVGVGGLLCAMGSASLRWVGEFVGLPLLGTGLIVLAIQYWWVNEEMYPFISAANLLLLFAVAGIMLTRWRMVLAVYWVARSFPRGKS